MVVLPLAEVLGQRLAAGDVGLAARRVGDGAVGAHEAREEVLHLAFARKAPADAHALPGRRRIDVEPGSGRELRQRIDVGGMNPMGAAIVRHAERLGVGDAASADLAGRLQHDVAQPARRREPPRGRDAGGAGADHDDIDVAGTRRTCRIRRVRCRALARRTERRPCAKGGGSGKERPASQTFHRIQVSGYGRPHHAGMAVFRQIFWFNIR